MPREKLVVLVCTLLGLLASGCNDDSVYAMFQTYEIQGDMRIDGAAGCMLAMPDGLSGGSSGAEHGTDGLSVSHTSGDDVFLVVVRSGNQELARREYTREFLLSGERDHIEVETPTGRVFELVYWGGEECDTSHLESSLADAS